MTLTILFSVVFKLNYSVHSRGTHLYSTLRQLVKWLPQVRLCSGRRSTGTPEHVVLPLQYQRARGYSTEHSGSGLHKSGDIL